MTGGEGNQLISFHPNNLKFIFELEKQSLCDLNVVNNTDNHVAFKVKTTSPKKYFVRPNTSIVQPKDSCLVRVTLQPQREYPPDMQCNDKFLLQSTIVPSNTDVDDLPTDTFKKGNSKDIKERKLKVYYICPWTQGSLGDEGFKSFSEQNIDSNPSLQQLEEERDALIRLTQHLKQELEFLNRRKQRRNDPGFSIKFASIVVVIGMVVGLVLNLYLSK